jgi:ubiquinone/menaquinone biosynthesis C-methylase UbiE
MKNNILNSSHFDKVAHSFDISSDYHLRKINEYATVPAEVLNDDELELLYDIRIDSGLKEFKKFINPQKGKKLLDVGCYLNLIFYNYHKWHSTYYGIDISTNVIDALKAYVKKKDIKIGGLECAAVHDIPYNDSFFEYVSCINVFEYFTTSYAKSAISEIARVIKPGGKFVADIPNPNHECFEIMLKVEKYFKRDNKFIYGESVFEELISKYFDIVKKDSGNLMVKYFLIKK